MVDRSQLANRLTEARLAAELDDFVRKSRTDPRFLRDLQRNPERIDEIQTMIREIMEKQHGSLGQLKPDDPLVKRLQRIVPDPELRKRLQQFSEPTHPTPPSDRTTTALPDGAVPPRSIQPSPSLDAPKSPEASNPFAAPATNSMNDRFLRWAQRIAEQNPRLRDSNTVKALLEEFDRFRMRESLRGGIAEDSVARQLAEGVDRLLPSREFITENLGMMLEKLPRPNLPDIQLPNIDLPRPAFPEIDLPSAGMPTPTGQQLGWGLAAVLSCVALLMIGYHLRRRGRMLRLASGDAINEEHDFVPRDPTAPINNRHDLVHAFESLSITQLGRSARNWNHRIIGEELGGHAINRRRAADHLANLYETARYAPESEELPLESLRIAQREIAFLAGNSPA
jgi:hypothetical protein